LSDIEAYLERPVFISGYHKSGTTLCLSILDGHPELVVIPEELNFFKSVLFAKDKSKAIREKSGFRMFLSNQETSGSESWRTHFIEGYPEFDKDEFNRMVEKAIQNHTSFKDLLLQVVAAFAEVDGIDPTSKKRWVSKTPIEEIYFPVMVDMFGEQCKFVYIVRDPRDVFTSISKWKGLRGQEGDQEAQDIKKLIMYCIYWRTRLNTVIRYQEKYNNVCIFRFEDLVQNTEQTLKQLCHLLEIGYSEELRRPTRHGKQWGGNSVYSEGFKGISEEPVGRFEKNLDPQRRSILEHLLYKEMVAFGYLDPQIPPSRETKDPLIPWRFVVTKSTKYQLRYFLDKTYYRIRYHFPQFQ
jgi:hypothetical protein